MSDDVGSALAALVKQGEELVDELETEDDDSWIDDAEVASYQSWVISAGDLLLTMGGPKSELFNRFRGILVSQKNPVGLKTYVVRGVFELLLGVLEEWSQGTLRKYEDIVTATVFDDFLDHASSFQKAGRTIEAATLATTVLEHALANIAAKHRVNAAHRPLEGMVAELVAAGAFNVEQGEKLAIYASVHRRAAGGEWDALNNAEVGSLIEGTRKLLADSM